MTAIIKSTREPRAKQGLWEKLRVLGRNIRHRETSGCQSSWQTLAEAKQVNIVKLLSELRRQERENMSAALAELPGWSHTGKWRSAARVRSSSQAQLQETTNKDQREQALCENCAASVLFSCYPGIFCSVFKPNFKDIRTCLETRKLGASVTFSW